MPPRVLHLLALILLGGCDPQASTGLLLRTETRAGASPAQKMQAVDEIGRVLVERGFTRQTYSSRSDLPDLTNKILDECGHLSYWVRSLPLLTYARVCLTTEGVRVTLSDHLRFRLSSSTQTLRDALRAEFAARFKNATVTVE